MVSKVFLQIPKAKMEEGSVKLTTTFPIQTSASSTAPDVKLVGNHGLYKPLTAHKLILARFSPLLFHVLAEVDDMIHRSKRMMNINGKHLLHVLVEVPVDVHTHLKTCRTLATSMSF